MMKKIYYCFGECGRLTRGLLTAGIAAAVIALVFLCKGGLSPLIDGDQYFTLQSAWFLFFLAISMFALTADLCVHKICRDIAVLLKELEGRKTNDSSLPGRAGHD